MLVNMYLYMSKKGMNICAFVYVCMYVFMSACTHIHDSVHNVKVQNAVDAPCAKVQDV